MSVELIDEDRTFRAGDTVQLRSGGPLMVIGRVHLESDEIECLWPSQDGTIVRAAFIAQALALREPRPADQAPDIHLGDVVTLRCGSAVMTVLEFVTEPRRRLVRCCWFDSAEQLHEAMIERPALGFTHYEDGGPVINYERPS